MSIDAECGATMESMQDPGHTHVCTSKHDAGDHMCGACLRWFWQKPKTEG